MKSLRESFKTVLFRHKVQHGYGSVLVCDELLDALVACVPQPSREGLEYILDRWGIGNKRANPMPHGSHEWQLGLPEECVKQLMVWASGQETKRWCENCTDWIPGKPIKVDSFSPPTCAVCHQDIRLSPSARYG